MPATFTAADAATQHMERSLRTIGLDLTNLIRTFDLQTVSLLGLLLLAGIILFDLFSKGSNYHGTSTTYGSYGRRGLLDSSATSQLEPSARTSRSLESMTQIFESLANAAMRYEGLDTTDEEQPEPKQHHLK